MADKQEDSRPTNPDGEVTVPDPLIKGPFVVNPLLAHTAAKDYDQRVDAEEFRINKIVNKFEVKGIPILGSILGFTRDPKDLQRIAKALERLAPIVASCDELKRKRDLLEFVGTDPSWFAAAIGEFDTEFDNIDNYLG